jgi:hypothetical protein
MPAHSFTPRRSLAGIVFHSVLIGLGLGVVTTDRDTVLKLLLAISVHQFFEARNI